MCHVLSAIKTSITAALVLEVNTGGLEFEGLHREIWKEPLVFPSNSRQYFKAFLSYYFQVCVQIPFENFEAGKSAEQIVLATKLELHH